MPQDHKNWQDYHKNLAARPQELTILPPESCRKTKRTSCMGVGISKMNKLPEDQKNWQDVTRIWPQELTRISSQDLQNFLLGVSISKRLNYQKTTRTGQMQQESCRKTTRTDKITTRILPPDQKNFLYGGGYQQRTKLPEDHKNWQDATRIWPQDQKNRNSFYKNLKHFSSPLVEILLLVRFLCFLFVLRQDHKIKPAFL